MAPMVALCLMAPEKAWAAGGKDQAALSLETSAKDCNAGIQTAKWCAEHLEEQLLASRAQHREMIQLRSLRRLHRFAQLELFRARLELGSEQSAVQLIRELVATQPLTQNEILNLGPRAAKVAEREERAVDKFDRGSLSVRCDQACSVLVNETLVDKEASLPFGSYRVVVCASDPALPPVTRRVRIHAGNPSAVLKVSAPAADEANKKNDGPEKAPAISSPRKVSQAPRPELPAKLVPRDSSLKRDAIAGPSSLILQDPLVQPYLPRVALRAGIGIGLLGTIAGSTLIAMHGYNTGKCLDSCEEKDELKTRGVGIGVMSAGGAILVASAVLLLAERIRGKKAYGRWLRRWNASQRGLPHARAR